MARRFLVPVAGLALVLSASAAVSGIFAAPEQPEEDPAIRSTADGAMLPPAAWNCDLYVSDYRDWLDSGNAAGDWRFAGKTYEDAGTNGRYTWADWLAWYQTANCDAGVATKSESAALLPPTAELIGGIVSSIGVAGLASGDSSGAGNDSPG